MLGFFILFLLVGEISLAGPVVEWFDRVEINWSSQKIRFYGEASGTNEETSIPYSDLEKSAWNDGLGYIYRTLPEIRKKEKCWEGEDESIGKAAASNVSSTTYSYSTVYFGSGGIRILMESSLIGAFHPGGSASGSALQLDLEGTDHSGIVFDVTGQPKPCPIYGLYDSESGETLFDRSKMDKGSFEKNFMARWVKSPTGKEIRQYAGLNPVTVPISVDTQGRLLIERKLWDEVLVRNEPLLHHGKVVISTQ